MVENRFRSRFFPALLLVLAIVVAYRDGLEGPFVLDDVAAIAENPTIRDFSHAFAPPADRGLPVTGRPVVNVSLALNYAFGGLNPRGYHLLNVALHALVALALFGLIRRTLRQLATIPQTRVDWVAGTSAAWWACHPLQTAAVTYTIQRAEILVSLFYVFALYAFARSTETGARKRVWSAAAVVACALGMATKEVMVTAPLALFLYDRTFVAGSFRAAWRARSKFYFALAGTWAVLAGLMVQTGTRAGTAGFALVPWWDYALKQCDAVTHYVRLAFWPTPLVFDYGGMVLVEKVGAVLPQLLLVGAFLLGTAVALVKRPALGFAAACFAALLAPTSSVVPLADTMFEHRIYLALAALVVLGVVALEKVSRRWPLPMAGGIAALMALTVQRNAVYRSELALWQDTAAKRPASVRAHYTLGAAWWAAGRTDEAIAEYRTALTLQPDSPEANNNLGNALARMGRLADAATHYEAALRKRPTAETHNNLGIVLARTQRFREARSHFEAALHLRADFADAHNNLGNLLAQAGELDAAAAHYAAALRLRPDQADAEANWANVLAQQGQIEAAVPHYEAALRLRPEFADAHFNFAQVLVQLRRWPEAIAHYEAVLRVQKDYPGARENLARTQAMQDVFGK